MDIIPTDAFADILLRLPSSTRRRLRLVCRHWRKVIDERAAPARPRVIPLVFTGVGSSSAAVHVIDGVPDGPHRKLWSHDPRSLRNNGAKAAIEFIGTCNGLLCLCDCLKPGAAICLVNPATGEMLSLPPLPRFAGHRTWAGEWWMYYRSTKAYSLAYLEATARYKIVHVPCYLDQSGGFNEVQVLTLGDAAVAAAWRDVPVPVLGASCCIDAGIVSVDGATYWVTKGTQRVVAFDLEDERVAWTKPLPVEAGPGFLCHLTDARGRLGVVSSVDKPTSAKIEIWVLGNGRDREGWSCRYRVQVYGVEQRLLRPHFLHGEYLLTCDYEADSQQCIVFAHRLNGTGSWLQCDEVRIRERKPGTRVAVPNQCYRFPTFAYFDNEDLRTLRLAALIRR